jgi:hypothetical protein
MADLTSEVHSGRRNSPFQCTYGPRPTEIPGSIFARVQQRSIYRQGFQKYISARGFDEEG